ncbi:GspE/PulE family protein [Desulfonatronovibrio hydrogenovorans]|uniref:GspE/PulE family protein n=1 Tax=Desulfonatronovibrio hydrogenovorans TaxID=53245 RepID=UPI00055663AA|nr:GspE/PulE family protein [Desulfonatronovibrio hydrogenovorans]
MLEKKTTDHAKPDNRYAYLVKTGCLSPASLDKAMEIAKEHQKSMDDVLLDSFAVDKAELGKSLETYYDATFVAFDQSFEPPYELYEQKRLDPDFLKKYQWVPLKKEGNNIIVLVSNPFDLGRLDEIRFIFGTSRIIPQVATARDIELFIDHFHQQYKSEQDISSLVEGMDIGSDQAVDDFIEDNELSEHDSEVVRLVNALLLEAWKRNASDIHIEPNVRSRYCLIRLRIDGTCHEFRKLRLPLARPLVSRIKIMAHLDIAERRLPQDGKVKIRLSEANRVLEFRVATIPTMEGQEDVVMRVLASGKPMSLEELGLSKDNQVSFERLIHSPYGLILVVGPTGSGKTTTLHSAVSYINTPERKIWTAEDPVEISQEGLRQVQVNPKIGLTFASILRSFLRADPDVIMIGEMRDRETAHIGVEASLTGHVVFSTLHTNTAPETVTRLLDMNLDPFNFADSLLGVLGQRLIKTLCPSCKEKYFPTADEMEELALEYGQGFQGRLEKAFLHDSVLYRAKGCRKCIGGYKGRIGIHELMLSTEGIKRMIKYKKPTEEVRAQALKEGMLSIKQDGIIKVLSGITDIHQVRSATGSS